MKIARKTYHEIISFFANNCDTEQGGMIGSRDGELIEYFFPDIQPKQKTRTLYEPNIRVLNKELERWKDNHILFCGMIHSHLMDNSMLSLSDKRYIENILHITPEIKKLWFPIILYQNNNIEIVVHKIERCIKNTVKYSIETLDIED